MPQLILKICRLMAATALIVGMAIACTPRQPPAPAATQVVYTTPTGAARWPVDDWNSVEPETQGMDPERLSELVKILPKRLPKLSSLLIVRGGDIVLEEYFGGREPAEAKEIYSITKSVIASLIGIAIDNGFIRGVDMPLADFFPELTPGNASPEKEDLSLENVLTMTTGYRWSEDDIDTLYNSPDWTQYMLDLPVEQPPGSQFNYCTGCSHLLSAVLQRVTGMDAHAYARQFLFEPIGIRDSEWLGDSQGLPIGGSGLQLTPRDLARFGYLYLRKGIWDGRQVISPEWVETATRIHVPLEEGRGYGYQWWIRDSIQGYAALGMDGQMVAVIPAANLVVVFTAVEADHEVEFKLIEDTILPAVK